MFEIPLRVTTVTVRLTLAFLFLACVSGFGLAAGITHLAIIEAVNSRVPSPKQFEQLGWGASKSFRLCREYRRLYPEGMLLRRAEILAYVSLFSLVVSAMLLGFGVLLTAWIGGGALVLWFSFFNNR